MGRKRKTFFGQSAVMNSIVYQYYIRRLTELAVSSFKYTNMPDTVDIAYMERQLFFQGSAIFFRDDVTGDYLCLKNTFSGDFNVTGIPNKRVAMGENGYNNPLDTTNSIIIYNNMLRTNSFPDMEMFAMRLSNIDRSIDVNVNAQKTPVMVLSNEQQRLTMLNLFKEVDGNSPVIFGDKNLDLNAIKGLNIGAPFVADKLYNLKSQIWNEALTYLGISNTNIQKKERMVSDEVNRNQGGTIASRYSRLESRRFAFKQINEMYGLDIEVNYRDLNENENISNGGVWDE